MENPGGWGGPPQTLWNGNSRGVRGLKLNDHPWGGMDIFWKHTITSPKYKNYTECRFLHMGFYCILSWK